MFAGELRVDPHAVRTADYSRRRALIVGSLGTMLTDSLFSEIRSTTLSSMLMTGSALSPSPFFQMEMPRTAHALQIIDFRSLQLTGAHFVITDFGALRGFASRTPKCVGSLLVRLSADEFSIWMRQLGTLDFNVGTCRAN